MKVYYMCGAGGLSGDEKIRRALCRYLGDAADSQEISIFRDRYGKPRTDGRSEIEFSVTHTGKWWICAVGEAEDGPLGIDAELRSRRVRRPVTMAERFFSPAEARLIREMSEKDGSRETTETAELFLKIWVRKEAYLKYTGRGLGGGMRKFTVSTYLQEKAGMTGHDGVTEDPQAEYVSLDLSRDLLAVICRRKNTSDRGIELCGMK